jgi:hypothetical protein
VDSDSISIWTCFLNLLLEFIWTPYPSNLCPIGLPDLIRSDYPNLARTAYLNSTRSTLLKPYLITSLLTWPYTFISGSIILPDSSPNWSSTYPALHSLTRPNYLTPSISDLTSAYPALHSLTQPNYLTRYLSDRTSAYPIVPGHLARLPYPAR